MLAHICCLVDVIVNAGQDRLGVRLLICWPRDKNLYLLLVFISFLF